LRNNLIKKFREISNHLSRDLDSKLQEEEKRREEKRRENSKYKGQHTTEKQLEINLQIKLCLHYKNAYVTQLIY